MIELSRYIYENYPNLKNKVQYWQLLSLLDRFQGNNIVIKENNKILGAGFYIRVNDEILNQIEIRKIRNFDTLHHQLNQEGDNIFFPMVIADNTKTILRGLKEVIKKEKPKTISWMRDKFYKRRIKWVDLEIG